jgi:hypothetical protein
MGKGRLVGSKGGPVNKFLNIYSMLILIALLTAVCRGEGAQPEPAKDNEATPDLYQTVLGKSLSGSRAADILSTNNCSRNT